MRNVEERLRKVLSEHIFVEEAEVVPEADIMEDLGADSLDMAELIGAVENEFDVGIPDEDAERIHTVKQAIDYISQFPEY